MTETQYLHLKKPALTDIADITDINENMDTLDTEVNAVKGRATALETATSGLSALTSTVGGHTTTLGGHETRISALEAKTVSNKNATLAWGNQSTVATVHGTDIKVSLPANPNTDTWRGFRLADTTFHVSSNQQGFSRTTTRVYPPSGFLLVGVACYYNESNTLGTHNHIVSGIKIETPMANSTSGSLVDIDCYNTYNGSADDSIVVSFLCLQADS